MSTKGIKRRNLNRFCDCQCCSGAMNVNGVFFCNSRSVWLAFHSGQFIEQGLWYAATMGLYTFRCRTIPEYK